MRPIDRSLLEIFSSEQAEHVARIRALLQTLSNASGDPDPQASNPQAFDELLRRAHTLKGAAHAVGLEATETIVHGLESVFVKIRDSAGTPIQEARPLAERTLDTAEDILAAAIAGKESFEIAELEAALRAFPQAPLPEPPVVPSIPAAAATTPASAPDTDLVRADLVRVNAGRIDELVRSSSELLVAAVLDTESRNPFEENAQYLQEVQAEWRQMRRRATIDGELDVQQANACLRFVDRQLESLHRRAESASARWGLRTQDVRRRAYELYEDACAVRMTPADTVFAALGSQVRELAHEENKPVDFRSEGMETQADRKVLQSLKDSVLHLLRNAVSHGAQTEAERMRAGKTPVNTIRLLVNSRGDRLILTIEDDGRGIDREAVIQAAMQRGLVGRSAGSSTDVGRLLLIPGLSTAREVTNLSGRGLGLSVVQEAVTRLQGDVDIQPRTGGGTVIALSVPLAMSTQHLLFVEAGGQPFGIPTASIDRLLRIGIADIQSVDGGESIAAGADAIPLARLADLLNLNSPRPEGSQTSRPERYEAQKFPVVIAEMNGRRAALIVDALRDERDAVIKDTGLPASRAGFSAGAVPMEDGSVALVLSVPELFARMSAPGAGPGLLAQEETKKTASILVVDDSLTTRSLEKSILEAHGFQVRVAVDGMDALQKIRQEAPDLVISDVMMPRMTGFELLEALKGNPETKKIPVILVTSLESEAEQSRGLELGADAYIVKHKFDQRELMQIVRQIV